MGLTISFLVAVDAVGTISRVEVGRIPLGSMLMKVPGGNFLVLVVFSGGAIPSPESKSSMLLGLSH